jgi:hypothetical protein
MDIAWVVPLISASLTFVGGLAGAYLGSYLKKKGENLATHEDIALLKEQVSAVTMTTEQIKTEISEAAWNRQRRWELKKEVLIGAVNKLAAVEEALLQLHCAVQIPKRANPDWQEIVAKKYGIWQHEFAALRGAMKLVPVVCRSQMFNELTKYHTVADSIAEGIRLNNNPDIYDERSDELNDALIEVWQKVKKELGTDAVR